MKRIMTVAALSLLLMPASGRAATDHRILMHVSGYFSPESASSTVTIARGDTLSMTSIDPPTVYQYNGNVQIITPVHNLVEKAPIPRFVSSFAGTFNTVLVSGVAALPAGTYAFYCTRHTTRTGTLIVT